MALAEPMETEAFLADEAATVAMGIQLQAQLGADDIVFLHGNLGVGKTTLVRGLLRAMGFEGAVKSPTYTLLEPYTIAGQAIYHFDFYRILDPQELDFIGVEEILAGPGLKLVEWPEQAQGKLPAPDVEIVLTVQGEGRHIRVTKCPRLSTEI